MQIDYEQLREDLKQICYGAAFSGGFFGALNESFYIDDASQDELLELAQQYGMNTDNYIEE